LDTEAADRSLVPLGNTCPIDFTDLPPELIQYRDEGCDMAPTCLECPFPRCLEEDARARTRRLRYLRDTEISDVFESGDRQVEELAGMFGVSSLTVRRALKKSGLSLPRKARKRRRKIMAVEKTRVRERRGSRPSTRLAWQKRLSGAIRREKSNQRRKK
jgi:hypothetical protein